METDPAAPLAVAGGLALGDVECVAQGADDFGKPDPLADEKEAAFTGGPAAAGGRGGGALRVRYASSRTPAPGSRACGSPLYQPGIFAAGIGLPIA